MVDVDDSFLLLLRLSLLLLLDWVNEDVKFSNVSACEDVKVNNLVGEDVAGEDVDDDDDDEVGDNEDVDCDDVGDDGGGDDEDF